MNPPRWTAADTPPGRLLVIPERACSYLPGRAARDEVILPLRNDSAEYQRLMDAGFRRSGQFYYRPSCAECSACVPIRVPVAEFQPSASQRRAQRKNADVTVSIDRPRCDAERFNLFRRYQRDQHDGTMCATPDEYYDFLCSSAIDTIEMSYRADERLIGIGIVDVTPLALSSVYFYFDPDEGRRSLGVHSALCEIEECRRRALPYWYLGFHVADCRKMAYKADYRPHELLGDDGTWRRA